MEYELIFLKQKNKKMKKIINWFKKRTTNRLFIVLAAVCTIGFLIIGEFGAALIEFALFTSWIVIDREYNIIEMKDKIIEAQDKIIERKKKDIRTLVGNLADERKNLAEEREKSRNARIYGRFWMRKYLYENAKVDFINGKISANEFGKKYNYYTELIEKSLEAILERKEAQDENDTDC